MSFWVARNRQKPPEENAFAQRARRNRRGQPAPEAAPEPVSEPEKAPEPSEVADAMPDLQALREAARKAAALVHEEEAKAWFNPDPEEITAGVRVVAPTNTEPEPTSESETAAILADPDAMAAIAEAEAEKPRRGRKPSPEVQARNARVLEIVKDAEQVGISKPDIAGIMKEKEQQVYTSLRQLQGEGLVDVRHVEGTGYRWFAL